jgi:hypothetical protein
MNTMTTTIGDNQSQISEGSTAKIPAWKREVRPKVAAQMLGCSVGYVYSLMNDGTLQSRKLTRRGYERGIRLVSVASIEKYLAQPTEEAPA